MQNTNGWNQSKIWRWTFSGHLLVLNICWIDRAGIWKFGIRDSIGGEASDREVIFEMITMKTKRLQRALIGIANVILRFSRFCLKSSRSWIKRNTRVLSINLKVKNFSSARILHKVNNCGGDWSGVFIGIRNWLYLNWALFWYWNQRWSKIKLTIQLPLAKISIAFSISYISYKNLMVSAADFGKVYNGTKSVHFFWYLSKTV